MFGKSPLQKALERAAKGELSLSEALDAEFAPKGRRDAEAVAQALSNLPKTGEQVGLHELLSLFQAVEDQRTAGEMKTLALPVLLEVIDRQLSSEQADEDELAFAGKILAMYPTDAGFERLLRIVERFPDAYLWSVVFSMCCEGHPFAERLVNAYSESLGQGFARIAYLDFVNQLAIAGELTTHPFDSEPGVALLRGWLSSDDEAEESYAHSATAAIPFLAPQHRALLLPMATAHPALDVRIEAAWAAGKLGDQRGLELLVELASDTRTSARGQRYLTELERTDLIPRRCADEEFEAEAEMCDWLSHPNEYGKPPNEIQLVAARTLNWPPTRDRRCLRVFKYTYAPDEDESEPDVGYGVCGNITFSLFGESTDELKPLEVLALHCCWELEMDQRFEGKRTVQAGLQLLASANPELAAELPN